MFKRVGAVETVSSNKRRRIPRPQGAPAPDILAHWQAPIQLMLHICHTTHFQALLANFHDISRTFQKGIIFKSYHDFSELHYPLLFFVYCICHDTYYIIRFPMDDFQYRNYNTHNNIQVSKSSLLHNTPSSWKC